MQTRKQTLDKLKNTQLLDWERERLLQHLHYLTVEHAQPKGPAAHTNSTRPRKSHIPKGPAAHSSDTTPNESHTPKGPAARGSSKQTRTHK